MQQLALTFEPGLAQRYRDMRECVASRVYFYGLGRVAQAVDVAPSNLSAMLSGERNLPAELIEKFMVAFEDTTPALYWAARFLQDAKDRQAQALAALPGLMEQMNRLLSEAKRP